MPAPRGQFFEQWLGINFVPYIKGFAHPLPKVQTFVQGAIFLLRDKLFG
jgi:hypothetical protein